MNQQLLDELAVNTGLSIATSPLWKFKVQEFAEAIVEECIANLQLNGYDDASQQIQLHFEIE